MTASHLSLMLPSLEFLPLKILCGRAYSFQKRDEGRTHGDTFRHWKMESSVLHIWCKTVLGSVLNSPQEAPVGSSTCWPQLVTSIALLCLFLLCPHSPYFLTSWDLKETYSQVFVSGSPLEETHCVWELQWRKPREEANCHKLDVEIHLHPTE